MIQSISNSDVDWCKRIKLGFYCIFEIKTKHYWRYVGNILPSYIIAIIMFNVEIRYSSHTWVNVYFEPRSSSSL